MTEQEVLQILVDEIKPYINEAGLVCFLGIDKAITKITNQCNQEIGDALIKFDTGKKQNY